MSAERRLRLLGRGIFLPGTVVASLILLTTIVWMVQAVALDAPDQGSVNMISLAVADERALLVPDVIFSDDFETDRGWTVDPAGTDSATIGMWSRAMPAYTADNKSAKQLSTTVSGVFDLVTGPSAGASVDDFDIDGGVTSIRSPDISLPSGDWDDITLSFWYYLAHDNSSSTDDYLRVSVIGILSTTVLEERGKNNDDAAFWEESSHLLAGELAGQTVYLLVEAADEAGDSLVEAAIDDVVISVSDTTPPTSTASSPPTSTGGTIPVFWTAGDTASGLATVCLWYRYDSSIWTPDGQCSAAETGSFDFVPSEGNGTYSFQTVATDNAGNSEAEPLPGGYDSQTVVQVPDTMYLYLPLVLKSYPPVVPNSGFEDGWTGWQHGGELAQSISTADVYEGTYAALLGDPNYACTLGVPVGSAWMARTISVPAANVSTLRVHFRIWSEDKYKGDGFDRFQILVNGTRLMMDGNDTDVYNCTNPPQSAGWEYLDIDMRPYLGQDITLRMENWSEPDSWYNTWTYIDGLEYLP